MMADPVAATNAILISDHETLINKTAFGFKNPGHFVQ